jgi:long-chain fatty acid transport protein
MGRSAAGATAAAQDASTAFENPAGMTRLEKGGTSLGLYAAWFDTEFDADVGNTDPGPGRTYTNDGGNAGGFLPGLGNNLVVPLADELGPFRDLRFGFGVAGLFGGAAQYADDWVGRNFITDINMVILDVQPSLAVSVTDWLSIGVGMNILHAELAEFQLILPNAPPIPAAARGKKVKADGASDWQTSFTVGMLLEPWEGTRIGGGTATRAS